jgi:hypothetical protein
MCEHIDGIHVVENDQERFEMVLERKTFEKCDHLLMKDCGYYPFY